MPTTTKGFPYPASTAAPNVPADLQALAEAVDTRIGTTARGFVTMPGLSISVQTVAVTFPAGRFTTAPTVVVTVQGTDPSVRAAGLSGSATAAGVTLCGKATTAGPGSYPVQWIAIG